MGDIVLYVVFALVGLFLGWIIRWLYARFQLSSSEQKAVQIVKDAVKEADAKKRDALIETKEQMIKKKDQLEKENRERRGELQRLERRLIHKEENLERKVNSLEKKEKGILNRERSIKEKEEIIAQNQDKWQKELERISGLTVPEAKQMLIKSLENDAKHDAQIIINKIEQEANITAEKKAREIVVSTIQRIATDVSSEMAVTSVDLPNDEMKGRIIGREGRNIRTLETLTGVDIIIDDTPEAVVISCFDPIRKQIAKQSLERLISDGRIHPARIEEIVQKVTKEVGQTIFEEGEKVLFELGIHNFSQEGVKTLGRLHYRSSYGQNVLQHSKEVSIIAGLIASEIGADIEIAKRAALLHDIGKGIETESEGNHAEIGMDMAKKLGEEPKVINAIGAHHNDVEPETIEATLVQISDAISASRPGARRETLDNYLKRLENLEKIAEMYEGVEKAYAIQAGREIRIIVNNAVVDDDGAREMAKQIAKQIEAELKYPGRIKVTIIRETRILEYAR